MRKTGGWLTTFGRRSGRADVARVASVVLATAAALASSADVAPAQTVGDPARGKAMFDLFCTTCHEIGPGARHRTGPALDHIVGTQIGHHEGYLSSLPMIYIGMNGDVWTEDLLDEYLKDPSLFRTEELRLNRSSRSPILGFADAKTRADIIAYLAANGELAD